MSDHQQLNRVASQEAKIYLLSSILIYLEGISNVGLLRLVLEQARFQLLNLLLQLILGQLRLLQLLLQLDRQGDVDLLLVARLLRTSGTAA